MPFAGYLVSTGRFSLFWVATAGAVGCNLGSTAAYLVGVHGGRRAVERWGSFVLLRPQELVRAEAFFNRYGAATVFIGRLLPVIRTFIALPAGLARMPQLKFQIYTFVGSWLWCYALAFVGAKLGERWDSDPTLRDVFRSVDIAIAVLLVVGIGWFIFRRVGGRRGGQPL
jgi:membrane protein DedA with SNARE-associated domain